MIGMLRRFLFWWMEPSTASRASCCSRLIAAGFSSCIDRANGKNISTTPFVENLNWYKGIAPNGQPIRDTRQRTVDGRHADSPPIPAARPVIRARPSIPILACFTWAPRNRTSIFYKLDNDPQPEGYGAAEHQVGSIAATNFARSTTRPARSSGSAPMDTGAQNLMTTAGGSVVRRRWLQQLHRVGCENRRIRCGIPALLSNPGNASDHLYAGWPPVRTGRRRREFLCVFAAGSGKVARRA